MKDSECPRVLLINSQSIYENNATGITLRSMFEKYPTNRVMELCFWKKDLVYGEDHLCESILMPKLSRPLWYLFREKLGNGALKKLDRRILSDEKEGNKKSANRKENIKLVLIGILDVGPIFYSKEILKTIDEFKPEVVYTMGSTISILRTTLYISERYNCRNVLHFMDNWRQTLYTNSKLMKPFKRILDKYIERIENSNFVGLAISNKMAMEYSKLSRKKYFALMNCIPETPHEVPAIMQGQTTIFTYTGGLHLNRWKELVLVEKCLHELNNDNREVRLYIYTSKTDREKYVDLFNNEISVFKDYLPHNKVKLAYQEADILIHIESFEPQIIEYTKYSLSTKIPEYMASGKPILCFAPSTLAVYEYINEVKAGIAIDNYNDLMSSTKKLLNDLNYRVECGKNGIENVLKSHTMETATNPLLRVFKPC